MSFGILDTMYRYTITGNDWLTPSIMLLTLRRNPSDHKVIGYIPGQYAAIAYTHDGRPSYARCFSITSSPTDPDILQFSIRVQGRFTRALSQIEAGNPIVVRGAYGGFVLDPSKHAEVIFIAGGIGIAPFISMLRHMSATNYSHKVSLLYSVHEQTDIAFVDELRTLERAMPNLHIVYAVSKGDTDKLAGQAVLRGRLDATTLNTAIDGRPDEKTIFICGPPTFMKSMVDLSRRLSVPSASIITEAFNQGNIKQTGKVLSWPRNMYILGSLGVAAGAFAIMVSDIIKHLPATPLVDAASARSELHSKNNRESDIDAIIRKFLSNLGDGREDSPSAVQATNTANTANTTTTPTATTSTSTKKAATPTTTTNSTTPTATTTPTPNPTPAPAPKPVCTTSASGVTTCN